MISWNTVSAQTLFASYSSIITSSQFQTNLTSTQQNNFSETVQSIGDSSTNEISSLFSSYDHDADYEGLVLITSYSKTINNFTSYTISSSSSYTRSYSYTYASDTGGGTVQATSSFTSHTSSSDSRSGSGQYSFTTSNSFTLTYNTTLFPVSNITTTTSYYTTAGTDFHTVISTKIISYSAARSSTLHLTSTDISLFAFTTNQSLQIGTIVSAQNEWLWSISILPDTTLDFINTPSFISNIGNSFTQQTFWPTEKTTIVDFTKSNNTEAGTSLQTIPSVNFFTATLKYFSNSTSATRQITFNTTADNHFSRTTYIVHYPVTFITSETSVFGADSYTTDWLGMSSRSSLLYSTQPETFHSIYLTNEQDYSSSTLLGTTAYYTSISHFDSQQVYQSRFYVTAGNSTLEQGQSISSTSIEKINISIASELLIPINVFDQESPIGAFITPQELSNGGNLFNFASNLSFDSSRIPYPHISSVFSNIQTPVEEKTFYDDGTFSWYYNWTKNTLNYTKSSKINAAANFTSSSFGVFSNINNINQSFYNNSDTLIGGFGDISTASETAYIGVGGGIFTTIDTNGSTISTSSIYSNTSVSSMRGNILVNTQLPVFITYCETSYYAIPPIISFSRNKE